VVDVIRLGRITRSTNKSDGAELACVNERNQAITLIDFPRSLWWIRESHGQADDSADNQSLDGEKQREALWFENPPVSHNIDE
jgi:hypothetical protein